MQVEYKEFDKIKSIKNLRNKLNLTINKMNLTMNLIAKCVPLLKRESL